MNSNKGVILREVIHNILYDINKFNKNFNNPKIMSILNKFDKKDVAFISNVCLNSMRYSIHCIKIINFYTKKKQNLMKA